MNNVNKVILLTVFLLINACVQAESHLSELNCGSFKADFTCYFDLFSGSGAGISGGAQFRENPALLSADYSIAILDYSLPLSLNLKGMKDYINDQIDERTASIAADTLSIVYPDGKISAGQIGGVRCFAFNFKGSGKGSLGISFWRPVGVQLNFIANSVLMVLETDAGLRDEITRILLGNDLTAKLSLNLDAGRLAYCYPFKSGIKAAFGMDILHFELNGNAESKTEGFIRQYGGDTDIMQAFNDPLEAQYYRNSLDNSWQLDYEENILSWNAGASYQASEKVLLDAGYSQSVRQNISGSSEGVIRSLGAVDYEALMGESEGQLFDELLLEPSKMTYCNETKYICENLTLNYPGILRLGAKFIDERSMHQFIIAAYTGELSLRYQGKVTENGREKTESGFAAYDSSTSVDYTYGVKLRSKLEYLLNYRISPKFNFFINMQYLTLGEVMKNITDDDGEPAETDDYINFFAGSAGITCKFNDKLSWDLRLFGFPGSFLDSRLVYRF